jgi:hypothetical protein
MYKNFKNVQLKERELLFPMHLLLKRLFNSFSPPNTEPLMYLLELFGELLKIAGKEYFLNTRILEIGPKDGLDSKRLASCSPNELVMIDLPEKHEGNIEWIRELTCLNRYIEENLLYMSIQDYEALGKFRLVCV